ncbi:hypothetical protein BJP34_04245 [Moorena producens PAL-8-15-08-1]|uniref:DUF433 domain-containing protein n=1 Tax=Moorena producens PAL-8-15-08-1 TaxID=1458985 RepID=A0A1D8TMY6_9CYAN|nr:DUF433 domain-containing protein [Moorena producens]AOW98765.1 hypothetical protein BJP34_04245 [Moorena producens PAL-8-15-08-1]
MQLEDYFDFLAPDDIRIKGTRIGIEHIIYQYIHRAQTPEAIAERYRTVTLEQVYATILYYLHNKVSVSAYIADWLAWSHQMREQQRKNPPPFIEKLRKFKAEKDAAYQNKTKTIEAS